MNLANAEEKFRKAAKTAGAKWRELDREHKLSAKATKVWDSTATKAEPSLAKLRNANETAQPLYDGLSTVYDTVTKLDLVDRTRDSLSAYLDRQASFGSDSKMVDEIDDSRIPDNIKIIDECTPDCSLSNFAVQGELHSNIISVSSSRHSIQRKQLSPGPLTADDLRRLYPPLLKWQIRMLTLHPGSDADPISVDLDVCDPLYVKGVSVSGKAMQVEYEALSYCWGDHNLVKSLICKQLGLRLPITQNLFNALHRLRRNDQARYLWIDALCINQHDPEERASQVQEMLNVYKKARRVIAWLGEEGPTTRSALEHLQSIRILRSAPDEALKFGVTLCHHHAEHIYHGFSELFARSWFRRVWVRQETWAAGETLSFLCGAISLSRQDLYISARTTDLIGESLRLTGHSAHPQSWCYHAYSSVPAAKSAERKHVEACQEQRIDEPSDVLKHGRGFREGDILEVLQRTRGSECTDRRDHIYGLCGMSTTILRPSKADAGHDFHLTIDYTITPVHAFVNLAWYIIDRDGWLTIFYLRRSAEKIMLGDEPLPSWCPDWRSLEVPIVFTDSSYFDTLREFSTFHVHRRQSASARLRKLQAEKTQGSKAWHVLRLRGVQVAGETTEGLNVKVHLPSSIEARLPERRSTTMKLKWDLHAPAATRARDIFVLFENEALPVALRPHLNPDGETFTYEFVGTCESRLLRKGITRSLWHTVSAICQEHELFSTYDLE